MDDLHLYTAKMVKKSTSCIKSSSALNAVNYILMERIFKLDELTSSQARKVWVP